MTATRDGAHNPGDWIGDELTRRSTLRILARAVQLQPAQQSWRAILSNAVALRRLPRHRSGVRRGICTSLPARRAVVMRLVAPAANDIRNIFGRRRLPVPTSKRFWVRFSPTGGQTTVKNCSRDSASSADTTPTCGFVEPMTGIEPAYSAWEVDSRRPRASPQVCRYRLTWG